MRISNQMPEEYDIGTDDEAAYNDTAVVEHSGDTEALASAAWADVPSDPFAEEEGPEL